MRWAKSVVDVNTTMILFPYPGVYHNKALERNAFHVSPMQLKYARNFGEEFPDEHELHVEQRRW